MRVDQAISLTLKTNDVTHKATLIKTNLRVAEAPVTLFFFLFVFLFCLYEGCGIIPAFSNRQKSKLVNGQCFNPVTIHVRTVYVRREYRLKELYN